MAEDTRPVSPEAIEFKFGLPFQGEQIGGTLISDWAYGRAPEEITPEAREVVENAGYDAEYTFATGAPVNLDPEKQEPNQVTDTSLATHPVWISSARLMHKIIPLPPSVPDVRAPFPSAEPFTPEGIDEMKPKDATPGEFTDEEAAQWGLEFMGWFNSNLPSMALNTQRVINAPPEQKLAMYYLMKLFEEKKISWNGTKRFFKGVASDPSTYVGLSTLGIGTFVGATAKQAGKGAIRAALRRSLGPTVVGGIEGGAYTSFDDALRQLLAIDVDAQDDFNIAQNLAAAGVGALAGTALVGAGAAVRPLAQKAGQAFNDLVKGAMSGQLNMGVGPTGRGATQVAPDAPIGTGGVPFAPEVSANNLRLHQQRLAKNAETGAPYPGGPKNERRVIPAPEGSGLPDFVVGDITPEDWIARTESLMSPEDIQKAAVWYDDVYGGFLDKVDGDQPKASKLMGAWLAAQQNESPSNAMTNVLFMWEQLSRGVPAEEVAGKGLPSANRAALSVLTGEDITGGVGQKISDFIDAGERRDVRSIMGNDVAGGEPFVVDIHTARDTGLVDQKLKNHLTRLGYDVPDDVITDVGGGGIKGPMYENRAMFGRGLTDHLNSIGWQGRSDWKPREVQAVGWVGLTGMYGDTGGGDVASSFGRNVRRISMEAAPGEGSPAAIKYGERFGVLSGEQQRGVTFQVTQRAIDKVNERIGINLGNVVHATGGWQRFTNPSTVQQAITSRESAEKAANMLGYYLQQSEVWVNTAKGLTKNPKGYAVDLIESGSTTIKNDKSLAELWDAVLEADATNLIQGYQPIEDAAGNVGIRILVDKGGKKAKAAIEGWHKSFNDISDRFSYNIDVEISEAEIYKARNNWQEAPDGQGFKDKMGDQGRGPAPDQRGSDFDLDRQELEDFFGNLIDQAEREGAAQ